MENLLSGGGFAYAYTSLATLGIALMIILITFKVGQMRGKHGIKAPDTSGHPEFDRAYRAHMNTVESTVGFLPVLWVFAAAVSDAYAGIAGAVWIAARLFYAVMYWQEAGKRAPGFLVALLTKVVLLFWAAFALIDML